MAGTANKGKGIASELVRPTQFCLPGTRINFELHNYEATGGHLPPTTKPKPKRRSRLEKSPFIITAKETDSYLERLAAIREDPNFSFQREMHLSEDLRAIQQRSKLSTALRSTQQYNYVLAYKSRMLRAEARKLSSSEPAPRQHNKASILTLSKDPVVITSARITMPLQPSSIPLSLRVDKLRPSRPERSAQLQSVVDNGAHHVQNSQMQQATEKLDTSSDKLTLSALGGISNNFPTLRSKSSPHNQTISSVFHEIFDKSSQQDNKPSILIGDTTVSVSNIIEDIQQLKSAQLVSPTLIFSDNLRTPNQLVDLDMLSYDHNSVREEMRLSHDTEIKINTFFSDRIKEIKKAQAARELEPLSVTGLSVFTDERLQDEALKQARKKNSQFVELFTTQLKQELMGRTKTGKAVEIGEYMLYNMAKTVNPVELQQGIIDQQLEELPVEQASEQIPAIRPLPRSSHASALLPGRLIPHNKNVFAPYTEHKK